jgi:hypothetical protein
MRDDFTDKLRRILALRVGFRCSNPSCGRLTVGPTESIERSLNIGVAAHITGASPGGPRYDPALTHEQRAAIANGIWLCQNCAKLVDSDPERFVTALLLGWKRAAEERARVQVEDTSTDPVEKLGLAVYCSWQANPDHRMSGFIVELENLPSSSLTARTVRTSLRLRPSLPVLGLAKPDIGSGWYEDLHQVSEPLVPPELHPGESRRLTRILRLPGSLENEISTMTIEIKVMASDCAPVSGVFSIPVWRYGQPVSDDVAELNMTLTNAVPRSEVVSDDSLQAARPVPVASRTALEAQMNTCRALRSLLDTEPTENSIQRFFERNPILFYRFSPARILAQAAVLTKYRTDFVLLSENKELYLIELEAPTMRLITSSGQPSASYTHAFQQVLDWLLEFEEQYSACLRGFKLLPSDVISIRGVVIGGRDSGYSDDDLKKAKAVRHDRITFQTYDDVLRSMEAITRAMSAQSGRD